MFKKGKWIHLTLNPIFGLEKTTENTNQAVMFTKVDFWSNRPLLRTLTRLVLSKSTVSTTAPGAQLQTQLLHDQGHIKHCPNHVCHPTVVTVDVVVVEELVVVSKFTNTQDSKTNSFMNRWCLSFGAMVGCVLLKY